MAIVDQNHNLSFIEYKASIIQHIGGVHNIAMVAYAICGRGQATIPIFESYLQILNAEKGRAGTIFYCYSGVNCFTFNAGEDSDSC